MVVSTSVVNSGCSPRYCGAERPKKNHHITSLQSGAFGEQGFPGRKTVERGGPIVGPSGHYLVGAQNECVSVFWRFFR